MEVELWTRPSSSSSSFEEEDNDQQVLDSVYTRMPNTAFLISMGLLGNSIAWKAASYADIFQGGFEHGEIVNVFFWISSIVSFVVIGTCYLWKCWFRPDLVRQEWQSPIRAHYMNTPHLILLMLAIGWPNQFFGTPVMGWRIMWTIGFIMQLCITQLMYERWFFANGAGQWLAHANPQFLLSTVGWFLLSVLGSIIGIAEDWGIALPSFCLGVGSVQYLMVIVNIFNGTNCTTCGVSRGSPDLFLLIAPPSVGVIAIDLLDGESQSFAILSEVVLGWCIFVYLLLCRLGLTILKRPPILGVYWAYIFPTSALATALIHYASVIDTRTARVIAIISILLAFVFVIVVSFRMLYECYTVITIKGKVWGDPLLERGNKVLLKVHNREGQVEIVSMAATV